MPAKNAVLGKSEKGNSDPTLSLGREGEGIPAKQQKWGCIYTLSFGYRANDNEVL